MTPAQCRAARGLLGMEQQELARLASVNRTTVIDFEKAERAPQSRTVAAIRAALEAAGVEFTNGDAPGVRLAPRRG